MGRTRAILAAALCLLIFTACSTPFAINRGESTDDGRIKVGIILADADKSTVNKTADIIALDNEIISGIENAPNLKHVPVSECDYLVSVVKLNNLTLNRALNINYMVLAYSLTHFKTKTEMHTVSIFPKFEAKNFASGTLVPHLTKFILQTQKDTKPVLLPGGS